MKMQLVEIKKMKIGFVESLKETARSMPFLISILMSLVIGAVIVGVTVYQVTAGNIDVASGFSTFLNETLPTSAVSSFTAVLTALGVIFALLIVVVIIILFRKFIQTEDDKGDKY
jgi:uncharacterized membrane protein